MLEPWGVEMTTTHMIELHFIQFSFEFLFLPFHYVLIVDSLNFN